MDSASTTVQMPLNVMDPHYESFEKEVLPILVRDEIGVLGMKSMGDKIILASGAVTALECPPLLDEACPTSVVITGCDSIGVLEQALYRGRNVEANELRGHCRPAREDRPERQGRGASSSSRRPRASMAPRRTRSGWRRPRSDLTTGASRPAVRAEGGIVSDGAMKRAWSVRSPALGALPRFATTSSRSRRQERRRYISCRRRERKARMVRARPRAGLPVARHADRHGWLRRGVRRGGGGG